MNRGCRSSFLCPLFILITRKYGMEEWKPPILIMCMVHHLVFTFFHVDKKIIRLCSWSALISCLVHCFQCLFHSQKRFQSSTGTSTSFSSFFPSFAGSFFFSFSLCRLDPRDFCDEDPALEAARELFFEPADSFCPYFFLPSCQYTKTNNVSFAHCCKIFRAIFHTLATVPYPMLS